MKLKRTDYIPDEIPEDVADAAKLIRSWGVKNRVAIFTMFGISSASYSDECYENGFCDGRASPNRGPSIEDKIDVLLEHIGARF